MATKPLTKWTDEADMPSDLVWRSKLDQRYLVEVQRTGEGTAKLCVFDYEDEYFVVHEQDVSLSYGARFGPDMADVASWQDIAIDVVDNEELRSSHE